MKRSIKINLIYQVIVLFIAVMLVVSSALQGEMLFVALGGLLIVGAIGTIAHIRTGQHNTDSKLPQDLNVKD